MQPRSLMFPNFGFVRTIMISIAINNMNIFSLFFLQKIYLFYKVHFYLFFSPFTFGTLYIGSSIVLNYNGL